MAEKVHIIWVNIFGVVLGAIEMLLASSIISFATNFNTMINQILTSAPWYAMPAYIYGLFSATGSLMLFGGIFVLVHSIKCVVDKAFMAYIAYKQPKPIPQQTLFPPPPTQR